MDVQRVVREARQRAGLSQRSLARRSGVGLRSVAAIESGQRQPTTALLGRLLGACGQQLVVQDGEAANRDACAHVREHLGLSLTERWQRAARSAGRADALHGALGAIAGQLVLEPAAAVPVWVPGARLELPLVVVAHSGRSQRATLDVDPTLLVFRRRDEPPRHGLVRVRAAGVLDLHVLPAAVLARQDCCRGWQSALGAAAALLHDGASRDDGGRRAPPHRQPDEDEEARRLSHALRYTFLPRPQAGDSRASRLGAPVSLPQWLSERGLPPLSQRRSPW